MSKLVVKVADLAVETNGDVIRLKDGKIEDLHIISPEVDSERMRMVGALGEMLYEQVKKAFGVNSLLVVAQHKDFKLVMFPMRNGLAVWKTNLDFPRIMSAVDSDKEYP